MSVPEDTGPGARYERRAVLGRGGQGVVELAWDAQQERAVALKVRVVGPDADRDAILDEARLLLRVPPHPNIALVRADHFEGDTHVLVMDFVDGPSLATRLEEAEHGLAPPDVVRWLTDVAAALDHLHAQVPPVIHGDVKPANVVITGTAGAERAVLVDFGLAATEGTQRRVAATAAFAAPELASAPPGPASDVYSLAATGYALLTGGPPVPGGVDTLDAVSRAVLAQGLAVGPERRPASAGALVAALADALGLAPNRPAAAPAGPASRPRRWLIGAASLLLVAALAYASTRPQPSVDQERASVTATSTSTPVLRADGAAAPAPEPLVGGSAPTAPRASAGGGPAAPAAQAARLGRLGLYGPDGELRVQWLLDSGAFDAQHTGPMGGAGWSTVTAVHDRILFCYRIDDGYNRLITVGADGTLAPGRPNPDVGEGWAHVVGLDGGLLFFYRPSDGYAATHRYGPTGRLGDQDAYPEAAPLITGYDRVVHAGANRVLLYASQSGRAHLIAFGDNGELVDLARPQLRPGWSVLAPAGHDLIVGVGPDGRSQVLRPSATGVATVGTADVGPGQWTAAVALADGTALHDPEWGRGTILRLSPSGAVFSRTAFETARGLRLVDVD